MKISPMRFRKEFFASFDSNFASFIRLYERFERNNSDDYDFVSPETFIIWILDNLEDVDNCSFEEV